MESIKSLIDPSANADSLCSEYYAHWIKVEASKGYPLTIKIKKIKKQSGGKATVFIANKWQQGTGGKSYYLSETYWVWKNKIWYRTGEHSKLIVDKDLKK